jgi:hypothetical protein
MRSPRPFYRLGGIALLLGALIFSLTKVRGTVDPDDSLLGYFMVAGFTLWLVGVAALYSRYGLVSGRLGKTGLGTAVVGVLLLAVAHPLAFMTDVDLFGVDPFMLVALGALALIFGPLLFGIAALRREVLPLFTGLMGFTWLFFFTNETGQLTFPFMLFRALFAIGWMGLGYVLWSDRRKIVE